MRRYSLSAAMLLALIAGPLSGCAHLGSGGFASSRTQKIEAQFDLARLAESEGQLDKSREMYESILKKDPSNAAVSHRLGIIAARQSNYDAAKRYFNEALRLDRSNAEVLNDLGYACYLSNDYSSAEAALESALKVDPQNRRATNNLALVVGSQGRLDESYALFRRVNKESEAHANVAYLYAQQGEGKKALDHYSRALTLEPDMKNAANAMVEIARLQQRMEADRNQERAQMAAKEPTPATPVQQVAAAKPSIPQLHEVIAEVNEPQPRAEVQAFEPEPARATEIATSANVPTDVELTNNDSDAAKDAFLFEDDEADEAPIEVPAATPRPATAAVPVITPSARTEVPASELEQEAPSASAAIDFVALCPEASDQLKGLLSAMNSQDVGQIKPALHKLGEMADAALPALPAVNASLKHADAYVRIHAALALWRIDENTEDTVPVFVAELQNADAGVRSFAATALAMGPQDEAVVAPLLSAVSDSNAYVRLHAAETLYQYPEHQVAAAQVILTHLTDKEANVRWLATFILGELLPKSEVVVTALTQALRDQDNRIRAGAAFALGGLGEEAVPALPELKKLTSDRQPEVRKAAEEAVRDIEHQSAHASAQ